MNIDDSQEAEVEILRLSSPFAESAQDKSDSLRMTMAQHASDGDGEKLAGRTRYRCGGPFRLRSSSSRRRNSSNLGNCSGVRMERTSARPFCRAVSN